MTLDPAIDLPMRSALLLLGMVLGILLAISAAWAVVAERWWSGKPILPTRPRRPAPWGGRELFLCFVLWQTATLIASGVLRSRRGEDGELNLIDAMAAVSLVNLALLVALPAMLVFLSRARPADFGLRRETMAGDLATGVVGALCLVPLVYAVQFSAVLIWKPNAHPLQMMLVKERSAAVAALALVSAVVLAPAAEELMFRGILQGWLEKRLGSGRRPLTRVDDRSASALEIDRGEAASTSAPVPVPSDSPWDEPTAPRPLLVDDRAEPIEPPRAASRAALLLPAALFAGVHFGQWPAPIPLFVLAVGLGVLYRRTGGLVAPIAMHATFNGLSTTAMIAVLMLVPQQAAEKVEEAVPVPPVPSASAEAERPAEVPGSPRS